MTPYYSDELAELWHHDARRVSDIIEPETVDLIVTSPPYFALRSYRDGGEHYDGQIGSEPTPAAFIDALIECTADWVKVLRPTGSMFVNLGDKRSGSGGHNNNGISDKSTLAGNGHIGGGPKIKATRRNAPDRYNQATDGIPAKSRMLLPHRYAIACLDRLNLIVRSDLVWSKPNGLPESVTDRCRDSHEYIFHLTRQGRYYTAIDAIREPHIGGAHPGLDTRHERSGNVLAPQRSNVTASPLGKLPGSVWSIPSEPLVVPAELGVDHFAAFPSELPRRCILGWTPPGYCLDCGEARRAVVSKEAAIIRPSDRRLNGQTCGVVSRTSPSGTQVAPATTTITGYACGCDTPDAPTRPAVVLDPFAGTGTTIAVAKALGRKGIGIDLSRDYLRLAEWRVNDPRLRRKVLERTGIKVPQPPAHDGQEALFT